METDTGAREPARDLRALREDYRDWYLRPGAEAGPCRDPGLLEAAARYLRGEPEPRAAFSVLRFPEALSETREALRSDGRRQLARFLRAAELLETLSTNLLLRGWRRELRSIKTYTGAFVYVLLPGLGSSTLQSLLASIGYLPPPEGSLREFRLCEDPDPDRALLLGFELLLARLECQNLLDLQHQDQLGPEDLLQVLHRRFQPDESQEPLEAATAVKQQEDEDEDNRRQETVESRENPPDPAVPPLQVPSLTPRPKPRRTRLVHEDQSLMEMQETYPDLAFRGRKVVLERPPRGHGSTRSSRSSRSGRNTKPAAPADGGAAGGAGGAGGPGGAGGAGGAAPEELSGPQAISLHITLRAGLTEQSLKPEDLQPTSEHEPRKLPGSPGSVDEETSCEAWRRGWAS
ncbi:spermatogenesis-associated protein 2-like [Salarias fasciatus]|uniref:spermatogenesis-associated protein 2-like n=1 Tax=Salarias fasciatus TaxID=181472 RepID=UPI00117657F0|nr:spermatogenesis-associated protein 2-like [Salarias fasciatus]